MADNEVVIELVRLEVLKLASNHADTQENILARADVYFNWVMKNAGQSTTGG